MDRNMRSSYVNSGPRSLPHFGKRHAGAHGAPAGVHGAPAGAHGAPAGAHGAPAARLNPPAPAQPPHHSSPQDEIITYIYESWNKVTRELERGSDDARYYQEVITPRQLANFRPFNLDEWWARRLVQSINRTKHRS